MRLRSIKPLAAQSRSSNKEERTTQSSSGRAVAAVSEGFDDRLAARAWFSSAYLQSVPNPREVIADYGEAIRLKPEACRSLL